MVSDAILNRVLTLAIIAGLGYIMYQKKKGNDVMGKVVGGNTEVGGKQFGIRKY